VRPATSTLFMGRKLGARLTSMLRRQTRRSSPERSWVTGCRRTGFGNSDLGRLECDLTAMADDLSADLDQLLLEGRQRPIFRLWRQGGGQGLVLRDASIHQVVGRNYARRGDFGSTCLIWLCSDESARPQVAAAINVVVLRVRATSGQPDLVRDKCRGGGVGLPVQPRLPTNEVPQFMARVDYRQAA
jgi:hypothetical protein